MKRVVGMTIRFMFLYTQTLGRGCAGLPQATRRQEI